MFVCVLTFKRWWRCEPMSSCLNSFLILRDYTRIHAERWITRSLFYVGLSINFYVHFAFVCYLKHGSTMLHKCTNPGRNWSRALALVFPLWIPRHGCLVYVVTTCRIPQSSFLSVSFVDYFEQFCVRLYKPYVRVPSTLPHCLIYTDDVIGHIMVLEWS
jgi:hypothetical protein